MNPTKAQRPPPMRVQGPSWSTACFGQTVDTSPADLRQLGEHLQACRPPSERWLTLGCAAERASAFIAARIITSLMVLVLLAGLVALAW